MEFSMDDSNWITLREKYILSLKARTNSSIKNGSTLKKNEKDNKEFSNEKSSCGIIEKEDSQNFSLRLSDSIIINDTIEESYCNNCNKNDEKKEKNEIIIISDSSDDDLSDKIQTTNSNGSPIKAMILDSKSSPTFSSVDISEIMTDDESKRMINNCRNPLIDLSENYMNKYSLITSDESNMHLNITNDKINVDKNGLQTPINKLIPSRHKENLNSGRITHIRSPNMNGIEDVNKRYNNLCGITDSAKFPIIKTTPVTNRDARNIAKVIKSKSIYNSPIQRQRPIKIVDNNSETSENTNSSQEMQDKKEKIKHPAWINETVSESDETTSDNQQEPPKPIKMHISRVLDPITIGDDKSATLSERKKEEISRWILSNPVDTRSDTSLSYVPPTEQNSVSSGNSSLERLELNYETPNNREKFNTKTYTNTKTTNKVYTPTKQVQTPKLQQTTMDSFLRKIKRDDKNISHYTPIPVSKINNIKKKSISPKADEFSNFQIADCADILDNLYGDAWRDKANDLFPATRSVKRNAKLQDRAVHTEKKKVVKPKRKTSLSSIFDNNSKDEGFNAFVSNIRPNFNSTKKSEVTSKTWRSSFINDNSTLSYSDGETTYETAMTTPCIPQSSTLKKKEKPISALTLKAIEICDSDTEDDNIDIPVVNTRRKLSFSDDEIDRRSSPNTSEYDPDDVIPIKSVIKPTKITEFKSSIKSSIITRPERTKSFLASLSTSIPLANAHPDAKKYRLNYKNTKDDLCKYLYKLYNDKIFDNKLPDEILIEWNIRMRGTAGFCYNKTKRKALGMVERSSRIVLATKILDAPDRLRDTLVHELCHAATWLINEVSDGHGPFWQAWASKAMRVFPELPAIKRCHDYKIATKYTYRCVSCGYSIGRHSKSLDTERKRCGHCYGKFELLINKTTKSGTVQVKTPSNKKPSGFALFVKENYRVVKREHVDVGHKEVMQILGQQFSAIKISHKNDGVENLREPT